MNDTTLSRSDTAASDENQGEGNEADTELASVEELQVELELLREENQRLRSEYRRARKAQYRRTAFGLGVLGLIAIGLSQLLTSVSDVLIAVGATGLFGGVLVYYLTPERLVMESVPDSVIRVHTAMLERVIDELGLSETTVYIPHSSAGGVQLYIPHHTDWERPDDEMLENLFLIENDGTKGIATEPTGEAMYREFQETLSGSQKQTVSQHTDALADGIVEVFELADSVETTVDDASVVFSVSGGVTIEEVGTDHPIPSFFATGLASNVEDPITVDIERSEDTVNIICSWSTR